MSGIAVVYEMGGRPAEAALLERMLSAIAHRGPDGIGRFVEGPVALGHAMLRTTPEALHESQPLADAAVQLCLTFHGRIDNREELSSELKGCDARIESGTDSELVLRAYQCWGEEAVRKILGDFAFALWDGRHRQLFCARDCVGAIPFYYWRNGHSFRAATELHQLFADPAVPREANEAMVAQHLADRHLDREETLFRHIMRLPPAHCLVANHKGIAIRRYFDLDPGREIRHRTDNEYAEHFFEIFREAVRCRLRTSGGIGCYLSGGLDSSSIVGMAQALYRDGVVSATRFETYSLIYPPPADEREYIRAVVRMWGLESNTPAPTTPDFGTALEQVLRYRDIPDGPNDVMANSLRALAQQQGIRIMLDGRGGDEWLDGSSQYYADLIRQFRFVSLLSELRADAQRAHAEEVSFNPMLALMRRGLLPFVPPGALVALKSVLGRDAPVPWLMPEFIRRSGFRDRALSELKAGAQVPGFAQREFYRTFAVDALQTLGHEMVERSSAAFGLEVRCPFHDRRLIEFCFAIPEEQRRRPFWTKFVMRNAMRGLLPEMVRTRVTKATFSEPFFRALQAPEVEELFRRPLRTESMSWVEGKQVREAYRNAFQALADVGINSRAAYRYLWPLWATLGLELWLKHATLQ
ncbi:MAG: asparagine synthase-related protein [Candidatus Binataceae bacterium]